LEDIHKCNVIHRNLKPENILLDAEGFAYLHDFTSSFFSENRDGIISENNESHISDENSQGKFIGTIPYCAPELLIRGPHNEKVDCWSLGVIAYELAHGETPWKISSKLGKSDIPGWLLQEIKKEIKFSQNLSNEFKQLITGLLKIDPLERFGIEQVKIHPFFTRFNWDLIRKKKIKPPYKPKSDSIPMFSRSNIFPVKILLSEDDQKQFSEWNWINPRFPSGITPEEEDIIFFTTSQEYPQGLQLYVQELSGIRGKIFFSIKEIPTQVLFCTERGTSIERISPELLKVGDVQIICK